jgi:hypothetical protein
MLRIRLPHVEELQIAAMNKPEYPALIAHPLQYCCVGFNPASAIFELKTL